MRVLGKELALYHSADALNFEACLTFLEDLCIPGLTCSDLQGPSTNFLIIVNVKVDFVSLTVEVSYSPKCSFCRSLEFFAKFLVLYCGIFPKACH